MALRPRTARRLALVAAIAILVVGGLLGLLVVPKWQRARLMEQNRIVGMQKHAEGLHHEAAPRLGRYLRAMGDRPVDPEIRLAMARSRLKYEVGDGGHVQVAIKHYRDYLAERRDDTEASLELLVLFVRAGFWPEARDLAVRLRGDGSNAIETASAVVIRHEVTARVRINPRDELIPVLFDRLLSEPQPSFRDLWYAFSWHRSEDRPEEADAIIERVVGALPDDFGVRVLSVLTERSARDMEVVVAELGGAIGLDTLSGLWDRERMIDEDALRDKELLAVITQAFDVAGRQDLSRAVLSEAARAGSDPEVYRIWVRRLWWLGARDTIAALDPEVSPGVFSPEVLGYQALEARRRGDEASAEIANQQLRSSEYDFRARAWLRALEGLSALDARDPVEARAKLTRAIEMNASEPMFYALLGDVHSELGRDSDAIAAWESASELASPVAWVEPEIRRIQALLRLDRTAEAGDAVDDLVRSAARMPGVLGVWLQTKAAMARSGLIAASQIRDAQQIAQQFAADKSGIDRARLGVLIATMHASLGDLDAARAELASALGDELTPVLVAEIIEIDQRYNLGLSGQYDQAALPEDLEDGDLFLRNAMTYLAGATDAPERSDRLDEALGLIVRGLARASELEARRWLYARAVLLSSEGHIRAGEAWQEAVDADPDNIDLVIESLDSGAFGYDLAYVDEQIDRITTRTATEGRTLPTRLRLIRARAVLGERPTRQSKTDAIAIIRSVIAAEPKNIRARNMLGNILSLEFTPERPVVGESESQRLERISRDETNRFEPDQDGAIEQFLAASRLISGPASYSYLLKVAQLYIAAGEPTAAQNVLVELFFSASGNTIQRREVAVQLRALGDDQLASRVLAQVVEESEGNRRAEVQLILAETYIGLFDPDRAIETLEEVSAREELSVDQLTELAVMMTQVGREATGTALAGAGERYGLTSLESKRVRARYAARVGSSDLAEELLAEIVQEDPGAVGVWTALINTLIAQDRLDEAVEVAERAIEANPDAQGLLYLRDLASGDQSAAVDRLLSEDSTDPQSAALLSLVNAFEQSRATMTPFEQIEQLRSIGAQYPANAAAQRFTLNNRLDLGDDPRAVRVDAEQAARQFPFDDEMISIAVRAGMAEGNYTSVQQNAALWRGRVTGSPIAPDIYLASAALELGDAARAKELLDPYLAASLGRPDETFYQSLLLVHSRACIEVGEAADLNARLTPLAEQSAIFRATVWIELAGRWLPDADESAAWLDQAERIGMPGVLSRLADAWLRLANRFPGRSADFLSRSTTAAAAAVSDAPSDAVALGVAGRAHAMLARARRAVGDPATTEIFDQAESFYLRAMEQEPENLGHLFGAARAAWSAERGEIAESHYRSLLGNPLCTGRFRAAVLNNLSEILVMDRPSSARAEEATQMADEAISTWDLPNFHGTRGWALLARGDVAGALAAFDVVVERSADSPEGWYGRAASLQMLDDDPGAREALENGDRLGVPGPDQPVLRSRRGRLVEVGVTE